MGAWSVASDQNDSVWDSINCGFELRMQGLGPLDVMDHNALLEGVREANPRGFLAGTVVWLLKMGCGLKNEELQKALDEMNEELASAEPRFPDDVEERKTVLHEEIEMVQSAMKNEKGYAADKYLVGVLGIFQVRMRKSDGTPWHAPARRDNDGKLVAVE